MGIAARTLAVLALVAPLSGCAPDGLDFRVDDRVKVVSPKDRSTVSLPVTLDWDVRDFTGSFAVFVDTSPMPPGKTLSWLARKDASCQTSEGCPSPAYLALRDVYSTTATELTLDKLPRKADNGERERHRMTIVLLDRGGHRQGESAFEVDFNIIRKDPS